MEDIKMLSMKRDMYNVGTQHNKLTTLVLVLLGELEKVKKEIKLLKNTLSSLESVTIDSELEVDMVTSNREKVNIDEKTEQILQQLNLSQTTKSI